MYVLAPNQTVETFPYSIGDLRRDNPNTSFPANPSVELLAEWSVFPVVEVRPEHDVTTQNLVEDGFEWDEAGQVWNRNWQVVEASEDEVLQRRRESANYVLFYNSLLTSATYQKIREQATSSLALTVACTEFVAAITDAKYGNANEEALQSCMNNIIAAATLEDEDLQSLERLIRGASMSPLYQVWDGVLPELPVDSSGTSAGV